MKAIAENEIRFVVFFAIFELFELDQAAANCPLPDPTPTPSPPPSFPAATLVSFSIN